MNLDILGNKDYEFLDTNPVLANNIILLTYGGSYAYGTNIATSDVDIRGITFNPIETLLGNEEFGQVEDRNTDTVIYGLNKMIKLLLQCNPNCIEILGCKPEHYLRISPEGQELLNNRKMFLSRRAIKTFGGYANNQLRRLLNALSRHSYSQQEKEKHIVGSISHAMESIVSRYHKIDGKPIKYSFDKNNSNLVHAFNEYNDAMQRMERFKNFEYGNIELYPDISDKEDMETEIYCNVNLYHYPLRDYKNIWSEINTIVKDYEKLGKRNTKKDNLHLNKHAMHLVRLYLMCIDILEKEEIITYREQEHGLLMDIRNGKFQKSNGAYCKEFFELIEDLERKMNYAVKNTSLPEQPNEKEVYEMLIEMNRKHINFKLE